MEKKNQVPKYPPLRFPEFTDEWKECKISDYGTVVTGSTPSTKDVENYEDDGFLWASPADIDGNKFIERTKTTLSSKGFDKTRKLPPLSVLAVCIGSSIGKLAMAKNEMATNQQINSIVSNPLHSPEFVYYAITSRFRSYLSAVAVQAVPIISKSTFERLPNSTTSLPEQRKIAALLSLIDERIEVQNAISNDLESLIVGFYNSVQYVTKAGWHKVRLRDLLTIRKEQNTSGSYEVYSVSVSRGIVNQIVHLGRSFAAANTSNYGVVHPGDLVYTKSPTGQFPFGIVKQNHNASPVAVSPLYGVYRPISPEIGTLLHYFFLSPLRANNYLAPLIQKGAKNTINIRTDHFLDNVVLLPKDEKELRCIADCLLALDERLSVEREYVELLKQQKAYLLRQMFI